VSSGTLNHAQLNSTEEFVHVVTMIHFDDLLMLLFIWHLYVHSVSTLHERVAVYFCFYCS